MLKSFIIIKQNENITKTSQLANYFSGLQTAHLIATSHRQTLLTDVF